jgi:dTMP kinase
MRRGLFIALEGGDGSGKSGALAHLAAALAAEADLLATREPGATPEGRKLRETLLRRDGLDWTPMAELLLIAADRAQHVERTIRPALDSGRLVLTDRYVGSTLAYQGAGRGLAEADIRALHQLTTGDLWPDLTLVLDVDPAIALRRGLARLAAEASAEDRFEALGLDFARRVRASFLAQATAAPGRHIVLDASAPLATVQATALKAVRRALAHWR